MAHRADVNVSEQVVLVEPEKVITEKHIDANNIVRNAYPPASEIIPANIVAQVESKADQETNVDTAEEVKAKKIEADNAEDFLNKRDAEVNKDNIGPITDGPEKEKQPQSPQELNFPDFGSSQSAPKDSLFDASTNTPSVEFPDTQREKDSKPLSDFGIDVP